MTPLIGLAIQYLPTIAGLVLGSQAKEVTDAVVSVAKKVFGTDDPSDIQAQIAADTTKLAQFVEQLKAETERFRIGVEDTQNARQQTIALNAQGSAMAWGAVVISVLVTLAFIGNIAVLFTVKVNFTEVTGQVLLLLTGTLSAAFTQVINYWLGSSAGSQNKDVLLQAVAVGAKPVAKNAGVKK